MASVNDLEKKWRDPERATGERYGGRMDAAYDIRSVVQKAWHPVSEPPAELDGDKQGYILIWTENGLDMVKWDEEILEVPKPYIAEAIYWARIRDVVLLPPEELH